MFHKFVTRCNSHQTIQCLIKNVEYSLYYNKILIRSMTGLNSHKYPYISENGTYYFPQNKRRLILSKLSNDSFTPKPQKNEVLEESKQILEDPYSVNKTAISQRIELMCKQFGKNPEFNSMMYNDDNVLNNLTTKQRFMKFEVDWDIRTDGNVFICKYKVNIPEGEKFTGETTGSNKKMAKKEAAREILSRLSIPTFEEMEENSKWIIHVHKKLLNAKDEIVDRSFGQHGHSCVVEWKVDDSLFYGTGSGSSIAEAELYANQDLYVQTYKYKKDVNEVSENDKRKKQPEVVFEEQLSKTDAGQMNALRNSICSKMKVNQQEKVEACPGGFQCTLTWRWMDVDGNYVTKVVCKQGQSKSLAKASASKAMLVEVGTIQEVTSEESKLANEIRSLINNNLTIAIDKSCELIEKSNCSVWRLFLPQIWEVVMNKRNSLYSQKLVNAMINSQREGYNSLPTDIWTNMLQSVIYVIDEEFASNQFCLLRGIRLDQNNFYSEKAMDYYHNNSLLLCMECQSCIYNEILIRNEAEHLYRNEIMTMIPVKINLPRMHLISDVTTDYLKNNISREDDIVLLLPLNDKGKVTKKSWDMGFICSVSKHKTDECTLTLGMNYLTKINLRPVSNENSANREHLLFKRPDNDLDVVENSGYFDSQEDEGGLGEDPFNSKSFGMMYIYNMITHKRMMEALQILTHVKYPINSNISKFGFTKEMKEIILHSKKCNQPAPPNTMLPTTMSLTPAQHLACMSAITNPITLIQGPPGTGKTHVACAIIDSWSKIRPDKRILAVADSNVAADNLIEGLAKRNISALRIGSSSESDLQEEAIKDLYRYNTYVQLRLNGLHKEANSLRVLLFTEAIKTYKIVIATCVGSGNDLLANLSFPYVIIDECAQSIEASNLIPIGRGCKSLVLIGDHKQLRPTIISAKASKLGLSKSFLERLIEDEVAHVHLLDVQRRMHPSIAEFPNLHFYNGLIRNQDVNDMNRGQIKGFKWPVKGNNLVFVDVSTGSPNTQFETSEGTSKYNTMEVTCVLAILKSFLRAGDVKENEIGILTPYDSQKAIIKKNVKFIKDYDTRLIEIDSVDGFQGKEKELVIFSAVRSNLTKDIGFLKDPRRMNVMLTRAKRGLVVLGDIFTLMDDKPNWKPFINWIYSKQLNIHISQLNNYLEYPCETLPKSTKEFQYLSNTQSQVNSSEKRKDQFKSYNDEKKPKSSKVYGPWD